MKWAIVIITTVLFSCTSKKQQLLKEKEEISREIDAVKAAYFHTLDSLDQIKTTDTTATRQSELMQAIIHADQKKSAALLKLDKRYHMVELKLRNY